MNDERSDLERLARPVPARYVAQPAVGKFGEYVPHYVINEILLTVVGPFDFRVEQVIYGDQNRVEGVTASLSATIDGRVVTVTEVGDCELPGNWKTQGARMKDAASDALKRCAMRLGLGLHLWCKGEYFLYDQLSRPVAEMGERPDTKAAESRSDPAATSRALSKVRLLGMQARRSALLAAKIAVDDSAARRGLRPLDDCDMDELDAWDAALTELERKVVTS